MPVVCACKRYFCTCECLFSVLCAIIVVGYQNSRIKQILILETRFYFFVWVTRQFSFCKSILLLFRWTPPTSTLSSLQIRRCDNMQSQTCSSTFGSIRGIPADSTTTGLCGNFEESAETFMKFMKSMMLCLSLTPQLHPTNMRRHRLVYCLFVLLLASKWINLRERIKHVS